MKRLHYLSLFIVPLVVAGCNNVSQQPIYEGGPDVARVFTDCEKITIEYKDNIVWQASGDKKIHVSCVISNENSRCTDIEYLIYRQLSEIPKRQVVVTINDAIAEASITADKELFGIPAGDALNDYFLVKGPTFSKYYVTYPDYRLETDINRDEHYPVSSIINADHTAALQVEYWLPNPPPERPDEVDFTFSYNFVSGATYSATCTMKFEY